MSDRPARLSRDAFRLFRPTPTRWSDNDVFQHVNNVAYYAFFDTAVTGFMIESGALDYATSPLATLVVETGCTYFDSVAFPDLLETGITVAHLGRSSVRYRVGVFKADAAMAAAQGHFVHVFVERASQRPVVIPDKIRAILAGIEG